LNVKILYELTAKKSDFLSSGEKAMQWKDMYPQDKQPSNEEITEFIGVKQKDYDNHFFNTKREKLINIIKAAV